MVNPQPATRRRRILLRALVATLVVAVVAGGTGTTWLLVRNGSTRGAAPTSPGNTTPSGGAETSGQSGGTATGGACKYAPTPDDSGDRIPPPPREHTTVGGAVRLELRTNRGALALDLDADHAPCAVNSFVSLANAGYFTETPCHRLTTEGIFLLQCGDPTGTGSGGPGYRFGDENLPVGHQPTYPRGTLAMANSGPDSNGSQFFLVYRDTALDPSYTVFGQVSRGMDVLDAIAAAGADSTNGAGDGPPNVEVTIQSVTPRPA